MLGRLILENYIPLLSSGITSVDMDLRSMINLIMGPNGVGKSKCLKELNFQPPENSNYRNGRKYVEWIVGKTVYKLDSRTGIGNGHSFKIDDGPELNTGGTYSVQKELVYNHLGRAGTNLTKVLDGLKITDRISAMTPTRRKELILELYPNDTVYALGVYNKLKQERNDLKSTIKKQIERHTEENRKLTTLNNCGVDELERRIKQIDADLQTSLLLRGGLASATLDPDLQVKRDRHNLLVTKLSVNNLSGVQFSKEELEQALLTAEGFLTKFQDQVNVIKGSIAENASFLEGMDDLIKNPGAIAEQAKDLGADLERTEQTIARYKTVLITLPVFSDDEIVLTGLEYIAGELKEYLGRVVIASSPDITSAAYKQYLVDNEQIANHLRTLNSNLEQMEHRYKHYMSANDIECPDCTHTFKVGISPSDISTLRVQIEGTKERIAKGELKQAKLQEAIDLDAEWYNSMNQLYNFVRANGNVRCLTELIREYGIGRLPHGPLSNALSAYVGLTASVAYRQTLLDEKTIVDGRLELITKNNVLDIANHVLDLEKQLVWANGRVNFYKRKVHLYDVELQAIADYTKDLAELNMLRMDLIKSVANKANVNLRDLVDTWVSELSKDKDACLTSIINAKSLTAVVESITADINRMRHRLKIVEVLQDGLCPNKGIIGKLMSDFINTLCGNVNAVVKQIWNTTLYVKPCSKENGDLNYKFPVVTGESDPTPDISDCSAGETDVIDWAFRFVFGDYVGFTPPLIMDEVGVSFDEIKRGRFFNFIQEYTQGKNPRQLFMVSHYFGQYGILKNPNIIAFKYEGLTMPGEPNRNAVIV